MRLVAIEEHFRAPMVAEANQTGEWARATRELGERGMRLGTGVLERLADLGAGRLAAMDAAGIEMQVLSHTQPGVEGLGAADAVALASATNDLLASAVAAHPDRFSGFSMLPTPDPHAAAKELERAVTKLGLKGAMVNGRTHGLFLDDPSFDPIFECAESLDVPIYLHPAMPTEAVRSASYDNLPPGVGHWLSSSAWGWHVETGLHALRLIAAGVFDRHPRLQVILGHMGEAIPYMLERTNMTLSKRITGLERDVKEYFLDNFLLTTSGFFSDPPLLCALSAVGADRILFAVDYPFSANEEGRAFIDSAAIPPADREKIGHLNARRLLKL